VRAISKCTLRTMPCMAIAAAVDPFVTRHIAIASDSETRFFSCQIACFLLFNLPTQGQ
jgi:hypothetical protein